MNKADATTVVAAGSNQVVLYLRTARREQPIGDSGESRAIAVQRHVCQQTAARLELRIAQEYIDDGVSGLDRQRPGLRRLLQVLAGSSTATDAKCALSN
jgi:DNA invertase Pin-like site-specific DNA recombinase